MKDFGKKQKKQLFFRLRGQSTGQVPLNKKRVLSRSRAFSHGPLKRIAQGLRANDVSYCSIHDTHINVGGDRLQRNVRWF